MPSYATEAEATAYFDTEVLHSEPWDGASSGDRTIALAQATTIMDRLNYYGEKADESQVNQFPRADDTAVPEDIKNASAEIAMALLDGVDPELEFENLAMISQGFGNVRSTYDRRMARPHILAGVPSVKAWRFIVPYVRDERHIAMDRV